MSIDIEKALQGIEKSLNDISTRLEVVEAGEPVGKAGAKYSKSTAALIKQAYEALKKLTEGMSVEEDEPKKTEKAADGIDPTSPEFVAAMTKGIRSSLVDPETVDKGDLKKSIEEIVKGVIAGMATPK